MEKAESIPVQPDQHTKLPDGDGCTPVNSLEQCQAIGVPSSLELNEDSNEPVKVQEQYESLRIKAQQSTTQVPSSTQTHIKGCTHLPGVTFPAARIPNGAGDTNKFTKGKKFSDLSEVEFKARSSKDKAWYDVERVLTHRILSSGEAEVRVRYMGVWCRGG